MDKYLHFRYIKKIQICILFLIGISHSTSINYRLCDYCWTEMY